ncbi:RacP protein [Streptomyces griseorubiginosus]|uniref:RacP protein n=1 Tax=Streptomyces griseorubiginosus TaxID=67304 RepID=A0A101RM69_9ACTN|nr:RacP protein [Streptomyces griseorubiginosus]
MTVRKRSPAAERHAEFIHIALMEAAPAGLPLKRLMGACELSKYQTRSGLAALRDLCGEREWPPLIWTRETGYHFAASEEELEVWERVWISEKLTQFRRMITGTLAPHLALYPGSRWANYLNTQIRAVEASLEMAASQTS